LEPLSLSQSIVSQWLGSISIAVHVESQKASGEVCYLTAFLRQLVVSLLGFRVAATNMD
jgi:hypothetical protein